jgi:hypothetical protein
LWLFFNTDSLAGIVKLDHAEPLGVFHIVAEHCSTFGLARRILQEA